MAWREKTRNRNGIGKAASATALCEKGKKNFLSFFEKSIDIRNRTCYNTSIHETFKFLVPDPGTSFRNKNKTFNFCKKAGSKCVFG